MQVASEKFPQMTNPQENPQTCYLLEVSVIIYEYEVDMDLKPLSPLCPECSDSSCIISLLI